MIKDIVIVGGGPAGSYLGHLLAKNGKNPIIFDHSHPREKPCGGGITALAIEKFPFLQKFPGEKIPEHGIELISPDGLSVMSTGKKHSFTFSRLLFDKFILDEAIKEGCKLIEEKVIDVKLKNNIWEIKTKNKIYKAKIIIGADGVNSIVRKKILSPIPKEDTGVCYGCFATSKKTEIPRIKFLDNKQGYIWCATRDDHLSIGIGAESSNPKNIKKIFNDFLSSYYPDITITSTWGAKIPHVKNHNFYKAKCAGKNWLLIGDAAGHVDSISGEGITYALWSAELASKAILEDNPVSYDKLWRDRYGEELVASCKMRDVFYNPHILKFALKLAKENKTISTLLYDVMNSQQSYQDLIGRFIIDLPKIIKDYVRNRI